MKRDRTPEKLNLSHLTEKYLYKGFILASAFKKVALPLYIILAIAAIQIIFKLDGSHSGKANKFSFVSVL